MSTASGKELEMVGKNLFEQMQLECITDLAQVPLKQLHPTGGYVDGEHLEVDFLIPVHDICLIGEITSRNSTEARRKYLTFRRHIMTLRSAFQERTSSKEKEDFWRLVGVRGHDIQKLRSVRDLSAFIILTEVQESQFDQASHPIPVLFQYNWRILQEYGQCIGKYARYPFLEMFGLATALDGRTEESVIVKGSQLLSVPHRFVTSQREAKYRCHVLTFAINPYTLLPLARVYRRDCLPDPFSVGNRYQRLLILRKLTAIRTELLGNPDFAFPNSVLLILSKECTFDEKQGVLAIPKRHGAVSVVDGQHRLFAYASDRIERRMGRTCQLLATALYFERASSSDLEKFSARTFIEINTNQTKVAPLHLEGIAYEVLGKTDARSIAAHVLRTLNERQNSVRGVFRTIDSPNGVLRITEVIGALGRITNVRLLAELSQQKSDEARFCKQGYTRLMGASSKELEKPKELVKRRIICMERYFNLLARTFSTDFPKITPVPTISKRSALELTKMFSAFVLLFQQFIREGLNWTNLEQELQAIKENVMLLRRVPEDTDLIFRLENPAIPNARQRIGDDFKFLNANRKEPTSIGKIVPTT